MPSPAAARLPDYHKDQDQKTSPMENSRDLQYKVNAPRDREEGKYTTAEDQKKQEEHLEELQAQLQTTRDQVHLQAQMIQSFQSLPNEFAKFNETFMKLQANPSIEALHHQVNNLLQDVQTERDYSRSLQVNYRNLQESNEREV